jgi:hypothetical protein
MSAFIQHGLPVSGWHVTGRCSPEVYTLVLALPGDVVCNACTHAALSSRLADDGVIRGYNPILPGNAPLSLLGDVVTCACCEEIVHIDGGDA